MIKIKKSETADTRTCDYTKVTKEQLLASSKQHISDVRQGIQFFISMLEDASESHDYTKILFIDDFYNDFHNGFKTIDWYKMHQDTERHHLKDPQYIQDDVNLIDVLEMIVDNVMAGKARNGKYREEDIPKDLLIKAYKNTIKLLLDNVEVEGG